MRKILVVIGLICCVFSSLRAQSFEGSFVMHVQDDNSVNMMNVSVRKDKLILQPIDPTLPRPVKVLMSKKSNDIFVLMEENGIKIAIKYTFDSSSVNLGPGYNKDIPPPYSIYETKNKKTLEGFVCREVTIKDLMGREFQLWITPEFGFTSAEFCVYLARFSAALNGGDYYDTVMFNSSDIYKKNMALEIKEVKEKDATIILIKKIVKATLPESDFTTDGYRIIDVKDIPAAE